MKQRIFFVLLFLSLFATIAEAEIVSTEPAMDDVKLEVGESVIFNATFLTATPAVWEVNGVPMKTEESVMISEFEFTPTEEGGYAVALRILDDYTVWRVTVTEPPHPGKKNGPSTQGLANGKGHDKDKKPKT